MTLSLNLSNGFNARAHYLPCFLNYTGTRRQSDTMRDRDYGVPRRGDLLNSGYDFYIGQPEDQIPYAPVTSQDGPKVRKSQMISSTMLPLMLESDRECQVST